MTSSSRDNESQPLLRQSPAPSLRGEEFSQSHTRPWLRLRRKITGWKTFLSRKDVLTLLCIFSLQFFISFAKHIVEVPLVRLLESAICNKYYRTHDIPNVPSIATQGIAEKFCKVAPVQDVLATVMGWRFSFDALPGILTAIHYGSFADRFGRKPVLILFTSGILASQLWTMWVCYADETLPVKLVWASSIFIFIGGGRRVFKSIILTVITDTVGPSRRTRYMYLLSSIPHVVTLIAPPFSNLFMRYDIWLPFEIGCGILVFTYFIIWLMPESLKHQSPNQAPSDVAPAFEEDSPNPEENEPLLQGRSEVSEESQKSRNSWMKIPREIMALFRVPNIPFIFYTFFLKPIALISKSFIFQHASESFGWEISQTTWLRVSQALGSAIVTVIFLPVLSAMLIRRGFHPQKLDLGAIRWSIGIAILGFGMLWLARTGWLLVFGLFICGLSEGLEPALQGLATASITETYTARMFTTLAVIETVGKLIGGPLMAWLFSIGRSKNSGSKGFNFLTSSVIFTLLEVYSWTTKVKQ